MTKLNVFLVFAVVVLLGNLATAAPMCQVAQLKVSEIAYAFPGMSQSYSFFAIQNISKTFCSIKNTPPYISAVYKNNKTKTVKNERSTQQKPQTLIVKPSIGHTQIGKDLVWFSTHADDAQDPGTTGYNVRFSKINIQLNNMNHTFTATYDGYPSGVEISHIHKGISDGLAITLGADPEDPNENKRINNTMIHFDHILNSG